MLDIIQTIKKYRKQFPSIKIYVCCDPADWDASKSDKASGKVRVQLNLNDDYETRIYEEKIKPISDKTVVTTIDKMYKKAIKNHIKYLKQDLKKEQQEAKKTRSVVTNIKAKGKEIQKEINRLSGLNNG